MDVEILIYKELSISSFRVLLLFYLIFKIFLFFFYIFWIAFVLSLCLPPSFGSIHSTAEWLYIHDLLHVSVTLTGVVGGIKKYFKTFKATLQNKVEGKNCI